MVALIPVTDVTPRVVDLLKGVPFARASERFTVPRTMPREFLVPQASDRVFKGRYVENPILDKSGRLAIARDDSLFPNYQARVFEVTIDGGHHLVMAGMSSHLAQPVFERGLPFLVYVPPSPQDNPKGHRAANRPLYDHAADADVPVYYGDASGYPYAWDWLFFQFLLNAHRLAYQLARADRPYVFVVPMVRSFQAGLGALADADVLAGVLLGIQDWYLEKNAGKAPAHRARLAHVAIACFSISTTIVARFLEANRNSALLRDSVTDLIVLDPPPGNPSNRSPIVGLALRMMSTHHWRLLLYAQDQYYINETLGTIRKSGLSFNPRQERLFGNSRLPDLRVAYLARQQFQSDVIDPVLKDVHNTFPNLFVADAVRWTTLKWSDVDGKRAPQLSFLDFQPTR
ncbi:MAG: hypothetical protein KDB60_01870 [Propionibacteriaceae bacterium]|nr:hypothetical protein [Propionibacteriaceae bacterium]